MATVVRTSRSSLEESALVDGCTRFEVRRKVVVPMARAGRFATAVFTFVFAWNDFIFALVLTRRDVTTFPVQVTHDFGGQSNFWAKIVAMSVLGTVPILITVATLQRYLVRGNARCPPDCPYRSADLLRRDRHLASRHGLEP